MTAMADNYVKKAKDDLEATEQEMHRLERDIARVRRTYEKLKAFIDAYSTDDEAPVRVKLSQLPTSHDFQTALKLQMQQPQASTTKAIVSDAAYRLLRETQPLHSRQILSSLREQGIEVGQAADQLLALSRILSQDGRFQASRAIGWSLKE
jgi:uncharacterized protein (DUF3084 family)